MAKIANCKLRIEAGQYQFVEVDLVDLKDMAEVYSFVKEIKQAQFELRTTKKKEVEDTLPY